MHPASGLRQGSHHSEIVGTTTCYCKCHRKQNSSTASKCDTSISCFSFTLYTLTPKSRVLDPAASAGRNGTLAVRLENPHAQGILGSHINLLCAGYGSSLIKNSAFMVIVDAEIPVSRKIKQRVPLAPVDHIEPFKAHGVELESYPADRLRWYDLWDTLTGVVDFVETYGFLAFTFEIKCKVYDHLNRATQTNNVSKYP